MPKRNDEPSHRDNDGLHRRRGVWYYCLTINNERRFFSTRTTNYQEARKIRSAAEEAQEKGQLPNDLAKWPFSKLLAHVRERRQPPAVSESTARLEKERSKPLLKHFGDVRVSRIDAATVMNYRDSRAALVSARTVNLELEVLRIVLKKAKLWARIVEGVKPLPENRRGPGRALEDSQEKLLFDTARSKPDWDAAFLAAMIAANTTMRGVEVKNLRLQDVNLIDREVAIRKSKTDAGLRTIPLNDGAMWAFARLVERANALGSREPDHFLFPRCLSRYTKASSRQTGYDPNRHQKTWRSAWRSLVKEAGRRAGRQAAGEALEAGRGLRAAIAAWKRAASSFRGVRFHDLRHHAITKLAESQASDATIMSLAGHLSREMMEHYSHVRKDAKRKAVDAIPSYIPEEKPVPATQRVQ